MDSNERLKSAIKFGKVIIALKLNPTFEELGEDCRTPITREQLDKICEYMGYSYKNALGDLLTWYGHIKLVD